MNRKAVWLAVAATVVGAGLAVWLFQGRIPEPLPEYAVHDGSVGEPPTLVGMESGDLEPGPAPPRVSDPLPASVEVVVRDATSGSQPVPGASVLFLVSKDGAIGRGVVPERVLGEFVLTDAVGRALLKEPSGERSDVFLRATHPKYRTAEVPWDGRRRVEMEIERGLSITGRVVDAVGRAVSGIRVQARGLDDPWMPGDTEAVAGCVHCATSAGDGSFEVGGLTDWLYELDALGDGWIRLRPPPGPEKKPRTVFRAGEWNVTLVMQPLRAYRIRFVDASLGIPLALSPRSSLELEVVLGEKLARREPGLDLIVGTKWPGLVDSANDPSIVMGLVLAEGTDVPATAQVLFDIRGYSCARAQVRLWDLGSLQRTDAVDEIRIHPVSDASSVVGSARVLVHEVRPKEFWSPPWRELFLWRDGPRAPPICVRGERAGAGDWLFRNLPAGNYEVALCDGGAVGRKVEVALREDAQADVTLGYEGKSGMVFVLKDGQGRVMSGVGHLSLLTEETEEPGRRRATMHPVVTHVEPDFREGIIRRWRQHVEPGTYTVSAWKYGYGWTSTKVTVEPGEIARVVLQFRPSVPELPEDG